MSSQTTAQQAGKSVVDNEATTSSVANVMKRSQWNINKSLDASKFADMSKICSICLSDDPPDLSTSSIIESCIAPSESSKTRPDRGQIDNSVHCYNNDNLKLVSSATLTDSIRNGKRVNQLESSSSSSNHATALRAVLISPCLCTGTRAHQHKICIEKWIEQTGVTSCPFCSVRYDYTKHRKSFWAYLRESDIDWIAVRTSAGALAIATYLVLVGSYICNMYMDATRIGDNQSVKSLQEHDARGNWLSTAYDRIRSVLVALMIARPSDKISDSRAAHKQSMERLSSNQWQAGQLQRQPLYHSGVEELDGGRGWPSFAIFCFACVSTALLMIGIVSMSLNAVFRHVVRYRLWSRVHFRVEVKSYTLPGQMEN